MLYNLRGNGHRLEICMNIFVSKTMGEKLGKNISQQLK